MEAKKSKWSRLDNAAKIFPSSSSKTDTSVFRFYCELTELVEQQPLQEAVNRALREFPNFQCVMRKGAFWYYLESTELKPLVTKEQSTICPCIYDGEGSSLLFAVAYYDNRISLEIYHALADGTGALQFLKTIVYYYLKQVHKEDLPENMVFLENDASYAEKEADGFSKYYKKGEKLQKLPKARVAYQLRGRKSMEDELQTIEAILDLPKTLEMVRNFEGSLTAVLTGLFIEAIYKEMPAQAMGKPIVIGVPVNLRKFFPTETARNFFGVVDITYDCSKGENTLENMVQVVSDALKEKVNAPYLAAKIHTFIKAERNPFAKIVPLPLKNLALKAARSLESRHETAVISNIGKITMPTEMCPYVELFGVLASTTRLQICMCSFGGKLQLGFTTAYSDTDIQKNMVRSLTKYGIATTVRSNNFFGKRSETDAQLPEMSRGNRGG